MGLLSPGILPEELPTLLVEQENLWDPSQSRRRPSGGTAAGRMRGVRLVYRGAAGRLEPSVMAALRFNPGEMMLDGREGWSTGWQSSPVWNSAEN